MTTDLAQHDRAIIRMQHVLEGGERIRKFSLRVPYDFAESMCIPDMAGQQVPIVETVGRAMHRTFPSLLNFFGLLHGVVARGDIVEHPHYAKRLAFTIAAHDSRVSLEALRHAARRL